MPVHKKHVGPSVVWGVLLFCCLLLWGACSTTIEPQETTVDASVTDQSSPEEKATVQDESAVTQESVNNETLPEVTGETNQDSEQTNTEGPFTLVVVPDTQYWIKATYNVAVTWLLENKKKENIVYLLHEGDLVHNNTVEEWEKVWGEWKRLEGQLPYVLAVGNHDMEKNTRNTDKFNQYFPYDRYKDWPTFGGAYEKGKMDNTYHLFSAGGVDWMVISITYSPDSTILKWANKVATDHPNRRILLLTHAYLGINGKRTSVGRKIWNEFVSLHKHILMVFNGHYIGGTAARQVSTGTKGNKVHEIFANYQTERLSESGAIRLLRFTPKARTVDVKTYRTLLADYKTEPDHQFTLNDVELTTPQP